jgi:hypothetical protein
VLAEPPLGYSAEEIAPDQRTSSASTGRRLVMMAYPQQYDDAVTRRRSSSTSARQAIVRMVDHEVLMPARRSPLRSRPT